MQSFPISYNHINNSKSEHIFSVSEISNNIRQTLEENFTSIKVRGEVSGLTIARSGHVYFSLKDNESLLSVVCWKSQYLSLKLKIEDGMEIICNGKISIYQGRSSYQLILKDMEISGLGTLLKAFEERKQKLASEGLFSPKRKKPIPKYPKTIGIITSSQGAVIKDMLHRIEERFPLAKILFIDVAVQGTNAAEQVVDAIHTMNYLDSKKKPDVIIVARGGGSIEDLWCFNEEILVRAAAASLIPLISAIGHETDFTLLDYAADLRAPTPTAAAELATPDLQTVRQNIKKIHNLSAQITNHCYQKELYRLSQASKQINAMFNVLNNMQYKINLYCDKAKMGLKNRINLLSSKLERYSNILYRVKYSLEKIEDKFIHLKQMLFILDPQNALNRGYAIITQNQHTISKKASFKPKDAFEITFADGVIKVNSNKN